MKKNMRVIKINGFRGLLIAMFIVVCLVAGFVGFPGYVAMNIWNYFTSFDFAQNVMPQINMYQGVLLWGIVAITGFIMNRRKKYLVSFGHTNELTDTEIKDLMEKIKTQQPIKQEETDDTTKIAHRGSQSDAHDNQ